MRATPASKTAFVCPSCGSSFERYTSYVKIRGTTYCSTPCAYRGRRAKPRFCIQCIETFQPLNPGLSGTGKFCSRACFFAHQRESNNRRLSFECRICGAPFSRPQAWVIKSGPNKTQFCSRACQGKGSFVSWDETAKVLQTIDGFRALGA